MRRAMSGPTAARSGRSPSSTTVTSIPRSAADAATSRPTKPPPTTTSGPPHAQPGGQGRGVVRIPQREDVPEIGPGDVQPSCRHTGGKQHPVRGQRVPVGCVDAPVRRSQPAHPDAEAQLDVQTPVLRLGHDFPQPAVGEVLLRQRRAFVGGVGVGVDDGDSAGESVVSHRRCRGQAGSAGSDDDVVLDTGQSAISFTERLGCTPLRRHVVRVTVGPGGHRRPSTVPCAGTPPARTA